MSQSKRLSLSIRLQPCSGTLMGEVASWLNEIEQNEVKKMVEAALIMAYLPYARANSGANRAEIERCCWETQDLLDKHGFNLRQSLQISQPQWYPPVMGSIAPNPNRQELPLEKQLPSVDKEPLFLEEDNRDNFFDDEEFE